ncbi:hypothetical protein MAR_031369, partial [Mya arenaria]
MGPMTLSSWLSLVRLSSKHVAPGIFLPLTARPSGSIHHRFGSRYLVDLLNKVGLSASYAKLQQFKACAEADCTSPGSAVKMPIPKKKIL